MLFVSLFCPAVAVPKEDNNTYITEFSPCFYISLRWRLKRKLLAPAQQSREFIVSLEIIWKRDSTIEFPFSLLSFIISLHQERQSQKSTYRRTISISILGTHRVSIQRQYHWLAQSFLNYYISPPRISFSEASRPEIFWFPCVCLAGYNFHLNCPPIHPNRKGPGVYLVCVITYWWESITRPATLAA